MNDEQIERLQRHITRLKQVGGGSTTISVLEAQALIDRLRAAEAAATRPAPCERFCEANAFKIEIRQLKAENALLHAESHHWAANNPGRADQYRAESRAARVALGLDPEADDIAPIDLINAIKSIGAAQLKSLCAHDWHHFGTEQKRRRCNNCLMLEPETEGGAS